MTKDKRRDIALAFIASLAAEHGEADAEHSYQTCPTCLARDRVLDDRSAMRLLRQYVQDERQKVTSPFALTPEQEAEVLTFDPWGERDGTYRTLRSVFATCRKAHKCDICLGPIAVGGRVWAKSEVDNGKAATFRFCAECCWCIAHRCDEGEDEEDPNFAFMRMEDRWEIGRKKADSEVPK